MTHRPRASAGSPTGTFQLFAVSESGKETLYRINTRTGQVWTYSEYVLLPGDEVGPNARGKAELQKFIEDTGRQGKSVYSAPYWKATPEHPTGYFTVR